MANINIDLLKATVESLVNQRDESKTRVFINSGVGKDFFSNLNKGQIPSVEKIIALADYLDVSVDYLLGRTKNPQSISNNSLNAVDIKGNNVQTIGCSEQISKRDSELLQKINSLSFNDYADIISYINSKLKSTIDSENNF